MSLLFFRGSIVTTIYLARAHTHNSLFTQTNLAIVKWLNRITIQTEKTKLMPAYPYMVFIEQQRKFFFASNGTLWNDNGTSPNALVSSIYFSFSLVGKGRFGENSVLAV